MNLKKIVKLFTSKSVGTGPLSYEKRIYRAAVSKRLRNTALECRSFVSTQNSPICALQFWRRFGIISYVRLFIL